MQNNRKRRREVLKILKNQLIIFLLILSLGFLVRLYRIDAPLADWHSWRQADTASVSRNFLERGFTFFSPKYHDISSIQSGIFNPNGYRYVELPIFNLFHAWIAKASPFSFEESGRLVSIFAWALSTVFVYLLGNRFSGKNGGIFSALFFAFIPFNIFFTRVILPEPLTVTFFLMSLWSFCVFVEKEKDRYFYLSALVFAAALLLKPYIMFFGLAHLFLAYQKFGLKIFKEAKLLIKFIIYALVALVPFFLWRIVINEHPSGIPSFDWAFNGDHIRFRPAFWRWLFAERIAKLILGYWGLIPFGIGLVRREKNNLFNLFFLIGGLLYLSVVATANVRHDYYQIFMIPSISLLAGAGASSLWDGKIFNQYASKIILIFSFGMMLLMGGYEIRNFYQINHPEIIEAGQAVDALTPKDSLVIAPYNGDTAFLYQTKRWGWPAIDNSVDVLIKRGADYYVSVNLGDADTKMITAKYKTIKETSTYVIADLNELIQK